MAKQQAKAEVETEPIERVSAGLGIRIRLAGETVHEIFLDDPRQSWIESFNRLHAEDGMTAELSG